MLYIDYMYLFLHLIAASGINDCKCFFRINQFQIIFVTGASQWPRPASQTALSPNYEGGLHALVSIHLFHPLPENNPRLTPVNLK